MTTTAANRLYSLAHANAVAKIGKDVFGFQNDVVKHALVAVEIVNIVNGQDDEMDSDRVRSLLFHMTILNDEQFSR